jgi:hypothetical protein
LSCCNAHAHCRAWLEAYAHARSDSGTQMHAARAMHPNMRTCDRVHVRAQTSRCTHGGACEAVGREERRVEPLLEVRLALECARRHVVHSHEPARPTAASPVPRAGIGRIRAPCRHRTVRSVSMWHSGRGGAQRQRMAGSCLSCGPKAAHGAPGRMAALGPRGAWLSCGPGQTSAIVTLNPMLRLSVQGAAYTSTRGERRQRSNANNKPKKANTRIQYAQSQQCTGTFYGAHRSSPTVAQ